MSNTPAPYDPWTPRQRQYMLWLATEPALRPQALRKEVDLAVALDVPLHTLHDWKRLPGFWDEVFQQARGIIGQSIAEILSAIVREAIKGRVQAQKLALEVLGVHHDVLEQHTKLDADQLLIIMPADQAHPPGAPPANNQPSSSPIDTPPTLPFG